MKSSELRIGFQNGDGEEVGKDIEKLIEQAKLTLSNNELRQRELTAFKEWMEDNYGEYVPDYVWQEWEKYHAKEYKEAYLRKMAKNLNKKMRTAIENHQFSAIYAMPGLSISKKDQRKLDERVAELSFEVMKQKYNVDRQAITKANRKQTVVFLRQMQMWYLKKYTSLSLKSIGEMFGGRDHTTVLHSLAVINNCFETGQKKEEVLDFEKEMKLFIIKNY